MKLLIHAAEEDATCLIDGHPFVIPPNESFEVPVIVGTDHNNNGPFEYTIPENLVAELIVKHCWHFGMVEIPVIRTKGKLGTKYEYDAEQALLQARDALIKAEEQILANYVKVAQERMGQGLPAAPPNGRALMIIEKRKIDLKKQYNITPAGYGTVARAAANQDEMDTLRQQNADLNEKFNRLMRQLGEPKSDKKEKI